MADSGVPPMENRLARPSEKLRMLRPRRNPARRNPWWWETIMFSVTDEARLAPRWRRSAGHVREPLLAQRGRREARDVLAVVQDPPAGDAPQARDHVLELAEPVAAHARDAHDLARAHGRATRRRAAAGRCRAAAGVTCSSSSTGLPHAFASRASWNSTSATDHQPGELGRVDRGRLAHGHDLPLAHHGDPVGDLLHLVQLVRDDDAGLAVGAQAAQRARRGRGSPARSARRWARRGSAGSRGGRASSRSPPAASAPRSGPPRARRRRCRSRGRGSPRPRAAGPPAGR